MLSRNEVKIIRLIKYAPVLIVACLSVLVTVLIFLDKKAAHKIEIENLEKSFIQKSKLQIKNKVNRVYDYIVYEKINSEQSLKLEIKNRVDEVHRMITYIYEKYKDIEEPEKVKVRITDFLEKYRFNNGRGYFYINDMDGVNYFHPILKKLIGKSLINVKDIKGQYLVQSIQNNLKYSNAAFNVFYWKKPGDMVNEHKKIVYSRIFKPYNWYLGTGEYVDDFEKEVKKRILTYINTLRYDKNGYVFVFDYDGINLAHVKKEYIGKNRIDLKDKNNFEITKEVINIAKKGEGYIKYIGTIKPETNMPASKTTYIKGFEDWMWAIGTGFYTDELEQEIIKKKEMVSNANKDQLFDFLFISLLISLLFLLLSFYISKMLEKRFLKYRKEVLRQINKNRQKDTILAQQSKMAAMGEMMQNIAHQWRQPLNTITTVASGVKFKKEFGLLESDDIESSMDAINNSSNYLSQTIEDFREFFNPNKKVVLFNLRTTLDKVFNLLETQFLSKNIEIIKDINTIDIYGFENELIQVMINLLNNSRDELTKKDLLDKKLIFVDIKSDENDAIIYIKDNAGGIKKEIMDRIFEPYFTTKHKSQGTGIGLYMSQEIIVKHMKGSIKVSNNNFVYQNKEYTGAFFEIRLSLKKLIED